MNCGKVPQPGRHLAAVGCALYALRGRAVDGTRKRRLVSVTTYAAHNKRGQRRERM